jgi:hypothetical protein
MAQHLLQMKAGNSEHERGLILEPNRTPDEMYMATQPSNRQNLSRCLQETSCRRPSPSPASYGRNGKEREAAHLFVAVAGEAQWEECLARPQSVAATALGRERIGLSREPLDL